MKDLLKELDNYINGESDLSLEELQEKCDCYGEEVYKDKEPYKHATHNVTEVFKVEDRYFRFEYQSNYYEGAYFDDAELTEVYAKEVTTIEYVNKEEC